jgi:hypothetical protein
LKGSQQSQQSRWWQAIDIGLIALLSDPGFIEDYLLFNRNAVDAGIAGRWILTAYVFLAFGGIVIVLLLFGNSYKMIVSHI